MASLREIGSDFDESIVLKFGFFFKGDMPGLDGPVLIVEGEGIELKPFDDLSLGKRTCSNCFPYSNT